MTTIPTAAASAIQRNPVRGTADGASSRDLTSSAWTAFGYNGTGVAAAGSALAAETSSSTDQLTCSAAAASASDTRATSRYAAT